MNLDWYELLMVSKSLKAYNKNLRHNIKRNDLSGWKPEDGKADLNKVMQGTVLRTLDKVQTEINKRIKEKK